MSFQPEEIEVLRVGLAEARPKFEALHERIVVRQFKTDAAREHTDHGLARRFGTMARCIEQAFALDPAKAGDYQVLGAAAMAALRSHDFKGQEKLLAEQKALTRFQPIMVHSLLDGGIAVFHAQLLADFATIEEMAGVLFDELDR